MQRHAVALRLAARTSSQPPADLLAIAVVELGRIRLLRRLAHADVELVGVVADQDAPATGLDTVEDDLCRGRCRSRCILEKAPRTVERELLDVLVRHFGGVGAYALHPLAGHLDFDISQALGLASGLDLARV